MEKMLAPPGIARFVEEAGGVEISEEIGRGLFVQTGALNVLLRHGRPHGGGVVPHGAGQGGGREVPVEGASRGQALHDRLCR